MIYDVCSFFNELDVLEERLTYLYNHVDYFVICESDVTHVGEVKPLYFKENENRFSKFSNKIIHKIYQGDKFCNAWINENCQRNYILNDLNISSEDKVIISDVDEIPSINFIRYLLNYNGKDILIAFQELSFFWPNYRRSDLPFWYGGSRGFNFKYLEELNYLNGKYSNTFLKEYNQGNTLTKIRLTNTGRLILNGGWHLSYMGGEESIKHKILGFAHTEEKERIGVNVEEYIKNSLIKGKGFFGKNEVYLTHGTFKPRVLTGRPVNTRYLSVSLKIKWYILKVKILLKLKSKYYGVLLLRK